VTEDRPSPREHPWAIPVTRDWQGSNQDPAFLLGLSHHRDMEPEDWTAAEEVRQLTRLLRTDEDFLLWRRLRELLEAQHVALNDAALAFSVEQGNDSEFGIIVTRQGDVYEYEIVKDAEADWRHMPDWTESPYGHDVRLALDLLRDERSDGSSSRAES
jgi:hypothetical protein